MKKGKRRAAQTGEGMLAQEATRGAAFAMAVTLALLLLFSALLAKGKAPAALLDDFVLLSVLLGCSCGAYRCAGKQQGGVVSHALIDLEIACLPKDLPEFIEIDLANLGMGEALHLSGIPLPAGVELADKVAPGSDQDTIVVSIHHPHVGEESSVVAPTTPAA